MNENINEEKAQPTIRNLLNELTYETTKLIKEEAALSRAEAWEKLDRMSYHLKLLIIGGAIAISGLVHLLDAVIFGVSRLVPIEYRFWLPALIVGLIATIIGVVCINKGGRGLRFKNLALEKTRRSLNQTAQAL